MLHDPHGVTEYGIPAAGASAGGRPFTDDDLRASYTLLLDRLEQSESVVHAFLPEPDRRARVTEALENLLTRYPDRRNRPPLFGVPLGVKDLFRTDGFATRAGSKLPPQTFAGRQAQSVTRLRDAGAIVVGKTVTTEFAYFAPGPTTNPWNPAHTPGGSSSGSAAAVAAGTAAIALGTQTIGSVHRPASFCGVVGFKPSYGRVPADGVIPFSPTADHVGLLAADVASARAGASVLWDNWHNERALPGETEGSDARQLTFVLLDDAYTAQADTQMASAVGSVAERLVAAGHTVVSAALLPEIERVNEMHNLMIAREFADVHHEWYTAHAPLYSQRSRALVERGRTVTDSELREAVAGRESLRGRIEALLGAHGAVSLVTPSAPGAAPLGLDATGSPLLNLPWTYAGVPTVTLRAGLNPEGLPLGVQLVGAFGKDERVLAVAAQLERILLPAGKR